MKFVFDARIIMDVLTRRMDEVQRIPTNKRKARYDRELGGCSSTGCNSDKQSDSGESGDGGSDDGGDSDDDPDGDSKYPQPLSITINYAPPINAKTVNFNNNDRKSNPLYITIIGGVIAQIASVIILKLLDLI